MRFDRLITLGVVSPVRRAWERLAPSPFALRPCLPILMYHSISDDPENGVHPYYRVCTSPRRFAEQMQWLSDWGYRGVKLSEGLALLAHMERSGKSEKEGAKSQEGGAKSQGGVAKSQGARAKGKEPWTQKSQVTGQESAPTETFDLGPATSGPSPSSLTPSRFPPAVSPSRFPPPASPTAPGPSPLAEDSAPSPLPLSPYPHDRLVVITFDDGFRDFHTQAFPVLQRHGFSATMYLPTAFIGDDRQSFKSRGCLTWGEVSELHQAGIEFGSHTVNHPELVKLSWPDVEMELRDSKSAIETRLRGAMTGFAYPYAFPQADKGFARRFRELLVATGYESCVTTEIGLAHSGVDLQRLPRLPANSDDDRALFAAKVAGAYDWLAVLQGLSKTSRQWFLR